MDPGAINVDSPAEKETPLTETGNPENEKMTPEGEKPVDQRMQGWSKNEIYDLLQIIKVFGSKDISLIAEHIPTKSAQQITNALAYYREKAAQHPYTPLRRKIWSTRKHPHRPPVPLSAWAKFLQDSLSFKDLHTEISSALRLIAEFENIPPAIQTDKIDFRNVYHSIANAMEGKTIPENPPMAVILSKCIVETALASRAFMRVGALQNLIEWIDMNDKTIRVLPRPTENAELATLRHLASQRNYNPLNFPENHFKPN